MLKWFKNLDRSTVIKNSFLLPILLVVIISISHVVSWYDLGNPIAWAIYLSVAIEVFALASISAASIRSSKTSIWFLFGVVTAIQIIGNVFFTFNDIQTSGPLFTSWVDLVSPIFPDWTPDDHRRLLALVQGGSLPVMSLTALHFYLKFSEQAESISDNPIEKLNDVNTQGDDAPTDEQKHSKWQEMRQRLDEDFSKFNPNE